MDISVVIPVYNSSLGLKKLNKSLEKELKLITSSFEIIYVEDKSKDDSFETLKEIKKTSENVKVIKHKENYGQQIAIFTGIKESKGKYVVTLDDDMEYPDYYIKDLVKKLEEGYTVVYGVEEENKSFRGMGSIIRDGLFTLICKKPIGIKLSSFRIIRREIVDEIVKEKSSFIYISAIILKYTKNIGNIKIIKEKRNYGKSNYNIKMLIILFFKIFIYYLGLFDIFIKEDKEEKKEEFKL